MSFLSRDDISGTMSDISEKVTEQASILGLYPVLKKATSSSPEPAPGYIYDVLIEFSYRSAKNSQHLGEYMNKRLQRHTVHGVLKTLKCIKHLVERGSRHFRKFMREADEHIKNAPSFGSQKNAYNGTALLEEIKTLTEKILEDLFLQSNIEKDMQGESPRSPLKNSLSGMGHTNIRTKEVKKYEGFGNSPIDKAGVTDSIRNVLDDIINAPDPKQELLESCLRPNTGQYQAAQVNLPSQRSPILPDLPNQRPRQPKQFTPGRAGGGWEDSSSEDDDDLAEFRDLLGSGQGGEVDVAEEAEEALFDGPGGHVSGSEEFEAIRKFCSSEDDTVNLDELNNLMNHLEQLINNSNNSPAAVRLNILYAVKQLLETESVPAIFRLLLVVEKIAERAQVPAAVVLSVIRTQLELRRNDGDKMIAVKTMKILAILDYLKDFKKSASANNVAS